MPATGAAHTAPDQLYAASGEESFMKKNEHRSARASRGLDLASCLGRSSALVLGIAAFGCPSAYAQEDQAPAAQPSEPPAATQSQDKAAATPAAQVLQQVIVTGTSIHGVTPTGSNLITVSRAAIDATSAQTTDQLLATVPSLGG